MTDGAETICGGGVRRLPQRQLTAGVGAPIPGPSTAMRNIAIFMLAFQQFLALTLIASVIPVVLRAKGVNLDLIGLFGAAMFAFTVNFLWAPVVDRYSLGPLGLRRSWLLAT